MPCPFTGPKMFCAGPNFLSQPKNLFTFCAIHKHFVPDKKMICIQQNCFLCRRKSFWRGTKCSQIFWLAQKIWTGTKHFGTCKRTRHKSYSSLLFWLIYCLVYFEFIKKFSPQFITRVYSSVVEQSTADR